MELKLIVFLCAAKSIVLASKSVDEYLNTCMKLLPEYSKETPSPEQNTECPSYKDRSCCRVGATLPFQTSDQWQNITNYVHCPQKSSLGSTCHERFFEELCFFLCSPDIGPWIGKATHDEPVTDRFINIPVCSSVCNAWYSACKDEYTCTDNWYIGFNKDNKGFNVCKNISTCDTYENVFRNASNFCEMIWDNSFKVVPDDQPCMKFGFSNDTITNNQMVAKKAAEALATSTAQVQRNFVFTHVLAGPVVYLFLYLLSFS